MIPGIKWPMVSVIFAVLALVFSFLIWNNNRIPEISEVEEHIRKRFSERTFIIPEAADGFSSQSFSLKAPRIIEELGVRYKFHKNIIGDIDGETKVFLQPVGKRSVAYYTEGISINEVLNDVDTLKNHPKLESLQIEIEGVTDSGALAASYGTVSVEEIMEKTKILSEITGDLVKEEAE